MREPLRKNDKTFTLRLTEEEAKAIGIMAQVARLSKNSFIRGCTHLAANLITDLAKEEGGYRPAARDLINSNIDLFDAIRYDEIDVLNENSNNVK